MTRPWHGHAAGGREGRGIGIVEFRTCQMARAIEAARDQNQPARQQRHGVVLSFDRHVPSGCECAGVWVVDLGAGDGLVVRCPANDENPSVLQQRSRVAVPRRDHVARCCEGSVQHGNRHTDGHGSVHSQGVGRGLGGRDLLGSLAHD